MGFIKRHPYLFWQCIGLFILAIDCLYLWFNLDNEQISYAFIVFSGMIAFAIIILSPLLIKQGKKMKDPVGVESYYWYKYIEEYYVQTYGWTKGTIVIIIMILLYIGGTIVLIYIGFPFLTFLMVYPDALIYSLWKKHVRHTFYQMPRGDKMCELEYVKDTSFLDFLYSQAAICYLAKPSTELLDFLYNRFYSETLNQKRLLINEKLKIYVVNGKLFNEKYGVFGHNLPMSIGECLLCILPDEMNSYVMSMEDVALRDYEIGGRLFSEYVKSCQELSENDVVM